jgi:hypothetical protein
MYLFFNRGWVLEDPEVMWWVQITERGPKQHKITYKPSFFLKRTLIGKVKKRSSPPPPSMLDLDAMTIEHDSGDGATWDKISDERRGEVDEDPPRWLTGLEEEEQLEQQAPQCEVASFANRSNVTI